MPLFESKFLPILKNNSILLTSQGYFWETGGFAREKKNLFKFKKQILPSAAALVSIALA